MIDVLFEELWSEDAVATWNLMREAVISGAKYFWLALAMLQPNGGTPLMPSNAVSPALEAEAAKALIKALLPWWQDFIALEDRFVNPLWAPMPWPAWAFVPCRLSFDMGMPDVEARRLTYVDAATAKQRILAWIDKQEDARRHY